MTSNITVTGRLVGYTVARKVGIYMVTLRLRQTHHQYSHQPLCALLRCGSGAEGDMRCLDAVDRLETGRIYRVHADALATCDGMVWAMGARAFELLAPSPVANQEPTAEGISA